MSWLRALLRALLGEPSSPLPPLSAQQPAPPLQPPPAPAQPARAPAPVLVTADHLAGLFPRLAEPVSFSRALSEPMRRYGIDTPVRVAAFLAQVGHESAGFTRLEENLNYSVAGLLSTFGRDRISAATAQGFGRKEGEPPLSVDRQRAIANVVYGGSYGVRNLGNLLDGDGWRFRGRGALQITGRANYASLSEALGVSMDQLAPEDGSRSWLTTPDGACLSACWWWYEHGCNEAADSGDFAALTRIINGGNNGLTERRTLLARASALLETA